MVCSKCGGNWKTTILYRRRMQICSKCGYVDSRDGSCDGVEHGPSSPLLTAEDFEPATLAEHLTAWWHGRRPMRPSKYIAFIKWSWKNWSNNWDDYQREQKELMDVLKKGISV